MTDRIGGIPASLITESPAGLPFLSAFRIRALPAEDQWAVRKALVEGEWWPVDEGWVFRPIEDQP